MKRRKKVPKKRRILDKKLIFSGGIIAIIVLGVVAHKVFLKGPEIKFSLKAAIIDQLGFGDTQNPEFNNTATTLLENAGFSVSYHESETIRVNFFAKLTDYNYGLIILRVHSALREDNSTVDLFTSEDYTYGNASYYRSIYGTGVLVYGEYSWEPDKYYFAITSEFIDKVMSQFPRSVIIAMGCWSLKQGCEQIAAAFIKKGAEAYIGWNDTVYQQDTDNETANLLSKLLTDKKLGDAIEETKSYPIAGGKITHLDFYPKSASNLTISELKKDASPLETLQITISSHESSLSSFRTTEVVNCRVGERYDPSPENRNPFNISNFVHKKGSRYNALEPRF